MNAYFGGTWERLEDGRFLEAGSSISNKDAGLPNIEGTFGDGVRIAVATLTGAFYSSNTRSNNYTGYSKKNILRRSLYESIISRTLNSI